MELTLIKHIFQQISTRAHKNKKKYHYLKHMVWNNPLESIIFALNIPLEPVIYALKQYYRF